MSTSSCRSSVLATCIHRLPLNTPFPASQNLKNPLSSAPEAIALAASIRAPPSAQANPIETNSLRKEDYRLQFVGRAGHVRKFDGVPVDDEERHIGYQLILGQQLISRFGNISSVFKKIDVNGDGLLSRDEIERAIRNIGFPYEEVRASPRPTWLCAQDPPLMSRTQAPRYEGGVGEGMKATVSKTI